MGQVPEIEDIKAFSKKYTIIGDGKVARHFANYFELCNIPYRQWSRRHNAEGSPLSQIAAEADFVLVLLTDSSIEPFIENNKFLKEKLLVHFSGTLNTPLALGIHPLMTFSNSLYDLATYRSFAWITDVSEAKVKEIFPALPNPVYQIKSEDKAFYHSLCVLAGNGTTFLWQKLFEGFENRLGLPKSAALPYLKRILANLVGDPGQALTGPWQRRDLATIRANLEALRGDPFSKVYQAFADTKNEVTFR